MAWRLFAFTAFAISALGCCKPTVCPKCPEPPAPLVVREACLASPPPAEKPVTLTEPIAICQPPGGPEIVGCLDSKNAIALADNVHAMQRWIREAWARCGKR